MALRELRKSGKGLQASRGQNALAQTRDNNDNNDNNSPWCRNAALRRDDRTRAAQPKASGDPNDSDLGITH